GRCLLVVVVAVPKAEKIFRTLAPIAPADLNRQYALADVLIQIGDSLNRRNQYDKAMSPYNEAQEIWQTLVDKQPSNRNWLLQLMRADFSIGSNLEKRVKYDEAIKAYRAVADTARKLVDNESDSSRVPENYLAEALYRIGSMFD